MRPVVYIDLLFLINFLMNTFTIYTTSLLLRRELSLIRLFLSSGVLAVYSCMVFFPQIDFLYSVLMKAGVLTLSGMIAFPVRNSLITIKNTIILFAVTAIYAGIIFTLIFTTNFGTQVGAAVSNGEFYFDIKASDIITAAIISYVCVYTISYIRKNVFSQAGNIFDLKIKADTQNVTLKAFGDTGCNLCEPTRQVPAIIITKAAAKKLLPYDVLKLFEGEFSIDSFKEFSVKLCVLPFATIGNKDGVLYGFVPKDVIINQTRIMDCVIAIADSKLCNNGEFDAIFNPIILEQRKGEYV